MPQHAGDIEFSIEKGPDGVEMVVVAEAKAQAVKGGLPGVGRCYVPATEVPLLHFAWALALCSRCWGVAGRRAAPSQAI